MYECRDSDGLPACEWVTGVKMATMFNTDTSTDGLQSINRACISTTASVRASFL